MIAIEAGYGDEVQPVFEGVVAKVGLRIAGDDRSELEVECRGHTATMTLERRSPQLNDPTERQLVAADDPLRGLAPGVDGEAVLAVARGVDLMDFHAERAQGPAAAAAGTRQIGIVTGLDEDPAGEWRIRIRLPLLETGAATLWARVAQLRASDGYGAVFMPGIDDEVVVGFLDAERSQPVVPGRLYGGRHRPPQASSAPQDMQARVTRSGHRLEFDDARQVVTFTSSAHNQVVLDDAEQWLRLRDPQGNQVQLHRGGIRLESSADLTIAARGAIGMRAGGATAELSAAGQTVVKGAMVMINGG